MTGTVPLRTQLSEMAQTPAPSVVSAETATNLVASRAAETRRAYRLMVGQWVGWTADRGLAEDLGISSRGLAVRIGGRYG